MFLDHQLAQQIVDRTMSIIGNNINVMNHAGIIIASGEKERIGEKHDGAILALQHGDTLEVNDEHSPALKGVKPGINLLLKNDGNVIGIIGITGNPDAIRDYAKLVKMTAEMIIEQALLVEQLQWNKRHQEEFIAAWVKNQLSPTELANGASRLNIDLSKPRVVALITCNHSDSSLDKNIIQRVVELLEYPARDNFVAVLSLNEIVVIKPYLTNSNDHKPAYNQNENHRPERLIERLHQNEIHDVNIAIGRYFEGAEQLHLSYESAVQVMHFGQHHRPEQKTFLFEDVKLPVLLAPLSDVWQGKQLCEPYQKLLKADQSGQLMKTLAALFEHQGNLTACAEHLYIHRNTLRYRLDKIEKITNISPHHFSGLVELYIALQISSKT